MAYYNGKKVLSVVQVQTQVGEIDSELSITSENAVQNKVITKEINEIHKEIKEINYELAVIRENLFETILTELPYKVDYATEYTIPSTLSDDDGTHRLVFSETQLDYFEGNSFVYNQLVGNGNFESTSGWNAEGTFTISNNIGTFKATYQWGQIYRLMSYISGHKYLALVDIKLTTATNQVYLGAWSGSGISGSVATTSTTEWQTVRKLFSPTTQTRILVMDGRASGRDDIQLRNFQLFDLTKMGIDSATTIDEAISELAKLGVDVYVYNPYNTGEIKNTTVSGLTSKDSENNTLATISFTPTELLNALSIHDTLSVVEGNVIEGEQRYDLIKTSNVGTYTFTGNETVSRMTSGTNNEHTFAIYNNVLPSDLKKIANWSSPNIIVSSGKGVGSSGGDVLAGYNDIISATPSDKLLFGFYGTPTSLYFYMESASTATEAKSALAGITIQSKLANTNITTTTIATDLTFEQVTLLIQEGGTIGVNFTDVPPNVQTKFVVKKAVGE